jgi:hypothetical protein
MFRHGLKLGLSLELGGRCRSKVDIGSDRAGQLELLLLGSLTKLRPVPRAHLA